MDKTELITTTTRIVTACGVVSIVGLLVLHARPAPFVDMGDLKKACFTSDETITCTFTNTGREAVRTCARGSIDGKSKTLAAPFCTGKIESLESKTIDVKWPDGFAHDVCPSENGLKIPDWTKCEFNVTSWDPR